MEINLGKMKSSEPVSLAGKKVLSIYYGVYLDNESGTLSGQNIENLHQMRVSTRRIRSLLKNFSHIFGPYRIQPFLDDFKRVANLLGGLRDIDTFVLFLESCYPKLAKSAHPAVRELIDDRLLAREKGRKNLNREFSRAWYKHLNEDFADFLKKHSKDDRESQPTISSAPLLIEKCLKTVYKQRDFIYEATPEEFHRLRIQFKRLRYLCEAFTTFYGKKMARLIDKFIQFQDILGAMQDHHRDIHFLMDHRKEILSGAKKSKVKSSLNVLIDHFEESIETERKKFFKLWKSFSQKRNEKKCIEIIRTDILKP